MKKVQLFAAVKWARQHQAQLRSINRYRTLFITRKFMSVSWRAERDFRLAHSLPGRRGERPTNELSSFFELITIAGGTFIIRRRGRDYDKIEIKCSFKKKRQ